MYVRNFNFYTSYNVGLCAYGNNYTVSVDIMRQGGIMRQHAFWLDKQQCNNVKSFSVYVLAHEEIEKHSNVLEYDHDLFTSK